MKVLKAKENSLAGLVKESTKIIKEGGIIVCPTDTVYGFLADAKNKAVVRKLYLMKKRPKNKFFPIFVADMKMAKKNAAIDKKQEAFLKKVWPGPVTAVLAEKRGGRTIGLRIPKNKLILSILKKLGRPIIETSVNLSGRPPARSVQAILKQFGKGKNQPDLIIDGGRLNFSRPSIVIDLTRNFKILRK